MSIIVLKLLNMKKITLFIFALLINFSFGQVSMKDNKLLKDGQTYRLKDYKEVFQNPEARNYFEKAKANSNASQLFAVLGGSAIGVGITRAIMGPGKIYDMNGKVIGKNEKPKFTWSLAGIGLGVVGIGIPFALAAEKNTKKAIALENGETAFQPYFKIETAGNGLALSYNF